jgi:predicted kinase
MAVVIQMHGEPGSGKSTVAREIGRRLGAVVLDKDVVKDALMRSTGLDIWDAGPAAYEVFYATAHSIAAQGYSVILDSPASWPIVHRRSREVADEIGVPYIMIECVCPDGDVLIERLATRDAMISQPRAPLAQRPDGVAEPVCERLVLDTTRPLADIVEEAMAYIEAGVPA